MWSEMEKMRREERRKRLQPRRRVRKDAAWIPKVGLIRNFAPALTDFHLDLCLWQVEEKNGGKSPKRISPGERRLL